MQRGIASAKSSRGKENEEAAAGPHVAGAYTAGTVTQW